MNSKTLSILAIAAAALVALTAWEASREQTVTFEFQKGQSLLAALDPAKIDTIEIEKGEDKVELKRFDRNSFRIASLNSYSASNREVNSLVSALTDIRLAAEATDDPAGHAGLNVDGGADCTKVRFSDEAGKPLAAVLVGAAVDGATHVRREGEDQVYRADGTAPYLRTKSLDYADKTLLQLARDKVARATVSPAEGKVYSVTMVDGEPTIDGVPEGMKVKQNDPGRVVGAVSYLSFTDLKPVAELEGVTFDNRYEVESVGGAVYQFDLGKEGETWWLKGRASYAGPELRVTPGLDDAAAAAEREKMTAHKEAMDATDLFLTTHQGWAYQIQSWTADSMLLKFEDLLEPDDGRPDKISASHILIAYQGASRADESVTRTKEEAKAFAEELLAQVLANPDSFADVAKEHSDGPSGPKGGDLGEFDQNSMAPPFTEAAFGLEVGAITSEVVETDFGFHIIQRTK